MAINSVVIQGSGNIQVGSSFDQNGDIISVLDGGTISNFTIANGANAYIISGGVASGTIVNSGSAEYISANAVANQTILNSGTQNVSKGGVANSTVVNNGGFQKALTGAIANNPLINSGGTLSAGGSIVNDAIVNGGKLIVAALAIASNTLISNNGTLSVTTLGSAISTTVDNTGTLCNIQGTTSSTIINNGGILIAGGSSRYTAYNYNTIINTGGQAIVGSNMQASNTGVAIDYNAQIYGSQSVLSGSIASNATIFNGGYQDIKSGGNVFETIVSSGGLLNIESGGLISGTVTIEPSGSAIIYNNAGGAIDLFGDSDGGITISGLADGGDLNTVLTVISGFSGQSAGNSDIITLAGIYSSDVKSVNFVDAQNVSNGDYVTLTLTNDKKITLNIIGAKDAGYSLGSSTTDGSLTYEVCFLTGTMIKTPYGERPIEDLRIGDQVITFDWKHNKEIVHPICWVGNKETTVNLDCAPDEAGYPVRILKNAIADGVPYKDLLVTPEHCLFLENQFIPARMLINNTSIYYDYSITKYTYYHIETKEHSIIWADGALTESYLDTGNRHRFRQHGNLVLFNKLSLPKSWDTNAGAPLAVQRSSVEPIYNKIIQRAASIGLVHNNDNLSLTKDPELYLVTEEGQNIYPNSNSEGKYIFSLPDEIEAVYLHSKTSRPCDVIGPFVDDRRNLGILVSDVFIFTHDKMHQIKDHLSKDNLEGWDIIEHERYRWTNGHAKLNLHSYISQKRIIVIQTIPSNTYIMRNNIFKKQHIA